MSKADLNKQPDQVSGMFDDVAKHYDRTNTVLSAGNAVLWRMAMVRAVAPQQGERILDVFSHPLEVVALGRGDQPTPFTAAQLAAALASDAGLSGVVLDPGGPWIRLTRAQLAPVLELAE